MARKKLNLSNPGDSTHFGSDDLDLVNGLLNGDDQTASYPVTTNTQWTWTKAVLDCNLNTFYNYPTPNDYVVFKSGTNFKAYNSRTGAVYTNADARTTFQYALDQSYINNNGGMMTIQIQGTSADRFPINSPGIHLDDGAGHAYDHVRIYAPDAQHNFSSESTVGPSITKGTGWVGDGTEGLINMTTYGGALFANVPLFQGLNFYGSDKTVSATKIQASRPTFLNCEFSSWKNGVWLLPSSPYQNDDAIVSRCRFRNNGRGVNFDGVAAGYVYNSSFGYMDNDSIRCAGWSHRIINNKMWQCSQAAAGYYHVFLTACSYGIVAFNELEPDSNLPNMIGITNGSQYNQITGNRFKSVANGRFGIILDGATTTDNIISLNNAGYAVTGGGLNYRAYKEQNSAAGNFFFFNTIRGGTFPDGAWELSVDSYRVDRDQRDYFVNTAAPTAQSTATALIRDFSIQRDANNNGISSLAKINGAVVEVKAF